jgi:hypothetical protein
VELLDVEDAPQMSATRVVLRWSAVAPAAIGSFVASYALMRLAGWLGSSWLYGETVIEHVWTEIVSSGVSGYAFVLGATATAPAHKRHVAAVAGAVFLLLMGAGLFAAFLKRDWWSVASAIVTAGGAAVATSQARDSLRDGE